MKRAKGLLSGVFGYIGLAVLTLVLGGAVGYGVGYLVEGGWLEPWVQVAAPPDKVAGIRLINGAEVWVESVSGALYHNAAADTCKANCWASVAQVPAQPAPRPGVERIDPKTCVVSPPLLGALERKGDCQHSMWLASSTSYARGRNGVLYIWQAAVDYEWSGLIVLVWAVGGAIVVFVLAWVALLARTIFGSRMRRPAIRARL